MESLTAELNKITQTVHDKSNVASRYSTSKNINLASFESIRELIKKKYKKPVKYLCELKTIEQEMLSTSDKLSKNGHEKYLEYLEKYLGITYPVLTKEECPLMNRKSVRSGGHVIYQ